MLLYEFYSMSLNDLIDKLQYIRDHEGIPGDLAVVNFRI